MTIAYLWLFAGLALVAILWQSLQKKYAGRGTYNNMAGETAYVGSSGISKLGGGEVTWSGTIMKAQLAGNVGADHLDAGSQVTIVERAGVTLIVKPKE